jgi:hypothetical protein
MLCSPHRAENVLYAGDYQDPSGHNFTVDIRYLANIDPKLASSTLLDRVTVDALEESYKAVYREAYSLRLCSWAPDKGFWVSLLGPKVVVRAKDKTMLGNRPVPTTRKVEKLLEAAQAPNSRGSGESLENPTSHVETWIERLHLADVGSAAGTASAVRHLLDAQASSTAQSVAASEDLIDFANEPLQECHDTSVAASEIISVQTDHTPEAQDQIPTPCQDLLTPSREERGMSDGNPDAEFQSDGGSGSCLSFTGDDCLIDFLAAVRTTTPTDAPEPSIHWEMPSLIPSLTDDHEDAAASVSDPGSESVQSRSSDGLLATKDFIDEVEAAITRLLESGPYRRGRVAVRAELGRAILVGADESGVAFNDPSTPSNGWKKSELIKKLDHGYGTNHGIHFTKVLSTYGCDIEDMIKATDQHGVRLWAQEPSRTWTTYTFHCNRRLMGGFIVDIEDHGPSSGGVLVSSVRLQHDQLNADTSMPAYIHAIRHHWDVQIVTSHVDLDEITRENEAFANMLLQSLSVLYVVPHFHPPLLDLH